MKKYRIGMFALLIIALVIAAYSYKDWHYNVNSEYGFLEDTTTLLDKAERAYLLEDKLGNISKAIQVYKEESSLYYEKSSLDKMEALLFLSETKAVDSLLPLVKGEIDDEIESAVFGDFWHSAILAIVELVFIVMCFIGIFIDYNESYVKALAFFLIIIGILIGVTMI